jgi:ankyrin repeat protein
MFKQFAREPYAYVIDKIVSDFMNFENMEVENDINGQNQSAEEMIRWIAASEAAKSLIYKYWWMSRLRFSRLLLESASRLGGTDLVRFLIAAGGNSVVTEDALVSAAVYDRKEVIRELLGADGLALDLTWPLVWSIYFEHFGISEEISKKLPLSKPAQTALTNLWKGEFDQSPLYIASEKGHLAVVRFLIQDRGVNPGDPKHAYTIQSASENGHVEVVKFLLQDGRANPGFQAIRSASKNGHVEVVRLLLQDGRVNPAAADNEAIREASRYGHTGVVRLLLQDGRVDPSADDNYAIFWASRMGHTGVVQLLSQDERVDQSKKLDPETTYNDSLYWASENGYTEMVRILLQFPHIDPRANDNKAIRLASKRGRSEVVRVLLQDRRVDPTAKDNAAISNASHGRHVEVVRLLLDDARVQESFRLERAKTLLNQLDPYNGGVRRLLSQYITRLQREEGGEDAEPPQKLVKDPIRGF